MRFSSRNVTFVNGSLTLLFALMLLSSFWGCNPKSPKTSSLEITPMEIDLGRIQQGESRWAVFSVTNHTPDIIDIRQLRSSCGCTSAVIDDDELQPGESTKIKAEMTNNGSFGPFSAKLSLKWNRRGKENPQISEIFASALAEQVALFTPGNLEFGTVKKGEKPSTIEIKIQPGNSEKHYSKIQIVSNEATLKSVIDPQDSSHFTIALTPDKLPSGRFHDTIGIRLLDSNSKVVLDRTFSASANIQGVFRANPSAIYLGLVNPGKTITGLFKVVSKVAGGHMKFKNVSIEPKDMNIKLGSAKSTPDGLEIPYTYVSPTQRGNASAKITITIVDDAANVEENVLFSIIGYTDKKS